MVSLKRIFVKCAIVLSLLFSVGCANDVTVVSDETTGVDMSVIEAKTTVLSNILKEESTVMYGTLHQLQMTRGVVPTEESLSAHDMATVSNSLSKVSDATKELLRECGVEEQELIELFGNSNDERLALVGIALSQHLPNVIQTRGLEWDDYVDCAAEAVGVNVLTNLKSMYDSGQLTRSLMKKAALEVVKQVARRFVGPVGVAITVADFGWCLYRNR